MHAGQNRTQVVTAGLAGEGAISIVVAMEMHDAAVRLNTVVEALDEDAGLAGR
jgi:hypothetical protein